MTDIARTDDKSNGHCEKETPLHLTIDTTTSQREMRPPLLASIAETEAAAAAAAAHYTDDDFDQNHLLSDKHPRMRAMSDSERALFSSGTGVRIPQKHSSPSPLYTQLTPPLSYSPANFDIHNPYSTSAHIFPADSPPNGLPDTPQSAAGSSLLPKRSSKTLRSSLSSTHHPRQTSTHTDGVARSQSYSFGGHSRQTTFVDASSYDTIPDSPAKNWLSSFAQTTAPTPAPDDEGQEIGSYVIGRQIGVGGFSVVKEAFTFENGIQVQHAVKIVRKHATKEDTGNEILQSHFEHEINVWKCLSSQYILPLISVIDTSYATWAFTLLFVGGTLFDVFKAHRQGLPPTLALKYSFQLASALRYLHEDARVVHRDIKLENCVIDGQHGDLRVCDFGLADFLPGDDTPSPRKQFVTPNPNVPDTHHIRPEDMVAGGSLAYAAPEQINSTTPLLDTGIDMWSYGVVVHALTIGELPFHDPFAPKLQMMITKGEWNKDRFSARVDPEICEVVNNCLTMDRHHRWTASEVLNSQWVSLYSC